MNVRRWNAVVWVVLIAAGALAGACRRTYVIVPRPSGGYRPDTLRATLNGNDARVIFRFDTVTHTRIVRVTDTLWREGTRIIHDTVRLVRRDTVRVVRRDTVRLVQRDTVRFAGAMNLQRDTVRIVRRDTVRVLQVDTVRIVQDGARVDTVRIPIGTPRVVTRVDTVRRTDTVFVRQPVQMQRRVDTVRVARVDTLRLVRVDTVRVTRTDTVRVGGGGSGGGGRKLFVPPGHYPPEGQCRVWIQDRPPGQQRNAAPCDALGDIPAGAFVLYGGMAWDFDHDWIAAGDGSAPPQIIALKRSQGRR